MRTLDWLSTITACERQPRLAGGCNRFVNGTQALRKARFGSGLRLSGDVARSVAGTLALEIDGVTVAPPSTRGARLALAMLALERRPHSREALTARLRPGVLRS